MKRIILLAAATAALAMGSMAAAAEARSDRQIDVQAAPAQLLLRDAAAPSIGIPAVDYQAVKTKLGDGDLLGALIALFSGLGGLGMAMTTLAANKPRAYELGNRNQIPVIASDIIYEGAAVGIVDGTGHARPLNAADRFGGFAEAKADNSAGAAAAINVDVVKSGEIELSVSGAVITDVGQPVYATDDDTFVFLPTGAAFIGFVKRFVSAGVAVVEFDAGVFQDPYGEYTVRETLSGVKTFDIEDNGKVFFADAAADGDALTLPAVATPVNIKVVAIGAFGTTLVKIDPAAADKIQGPDLPGTDNKDLLLTKATQRRGDFVELATGDANGALVTKLRGTWATEA